jgi:hypothetical protein
MSKLSEISPYRHGGQFIAPAATPATLRAVAPVGTVRLILARDSLCRRQKKH